MRYVLSEDEGSGLTFYKRLSAILGVCVVESSFGNQNFKDTALDMIENRLQPGDSILLAFDSIAPVAKFNPGAMLLEARYIAKLRGITVRHTVYYCFEEVYLSYSELLYLCGYYGFQYQSLLQMVHDAIMSKLDYYDRDNPMVRGFIQKNPTADKDREKFCKYLLAAATKCIKQGYFKQDSGNFGKCWLNDCNHQYGGLCDKCKFRIKATGRDKVFHLEGNSMSTLYCPFSDFFLN